MVIDIEDYNKRLMSHKYTPLLHLCPFPLKLAYLYDCLNRQYGQIREELFIFWWRDIGKNIWNKFFTVYPYSES
jgi:hypothetical protein